ncbi:ogr/Delta-like zinc finger family protein [Citrobacter braakii]|nr:ogr/Delta-like zinc finger family protein [Citrobacter braakii]
MSLLPRENAPQKRYRLLRISEVINLTGLGKTNRKHPQLYDVYCYCSNVECGHSFVMNVAFSHSVSPSALNGQGRVKELIDAIPPEERGKALKLLLAAQKNG